MNVLFEVKTISIGSLLTNCYILLDTESGDAAAVDCAVFDEDYRNFIKNNRIRALKYILLTHGHFDHISGVKTLKKELGGEVCMHPDDSKRLHYLNGSLGDIKESYSHDYCEPDIFIDENSVFYLGEHKIEIMHTPGHTGGSVMFICENIIFSGDTLFYNSSGRSDLPGGSAKALLNSLKRIGRLKGEYTIYPGHGEKTSLSFEKKYNWFLKADEYIRK